MPRTIKRRKQTRRRVVGRRRFDKYLTPFGFAAGRTTLQVAALFVLLHFNATHFDSGEVKTVVGTGIITVMLEVLGIRRNGGHQ